MTMLMTLCALPTSTGARACTRHTQSVQVKPVPVSGLAQKVTITPERWLEASRPRRT